MPSSIKTRAGHEITVSLKALQAMTRAELIAWLRKFDPDGDYSDEQCAAQGCRPHPNRALLALAVGQLVETDSLENDLPDPTIFELARGFCLTLAEWIGPAKLALVVKKNREIASYGRGLDRSVCATHEFCDANMAMHEAFRCAGLPTPSDFGLDDDEYPGAADLWNTVWGVAKEAEFDPTKIKA